MSNFNYEDKKYATEHYSQLIGHTIEEFHFPENDHALNPFPIFVTRDKKGNTWQVDVSCDQEGNGGGFLFIQKDKENKNDQ